MPGNFDEAGNNPFFTGYHEEQTSINPRKNTLSAKNPLEEVKWMIRESIPGISLYTKDWVWKELEREGVLERAGKEDFEQKVYDFLEDFKRKNKKIVEHYIEKQEG